MKRFCLAALAILFALFVFRIPSASAALWVVEAWRADSGASDFKILFNDSDGTGSVSYGDIEYDEDYEGFNGFSGVELTENKKSYFYPDIDGIPDLVIDGLRLVGETTPDNPYDFDDDKWNFSRESGNPLTKDRSVGYWTYTATLVPVPTSVLLLGSGLIGFIGLRRSLGWR